jgi:C4-dicarboxylate-specific signal transduction histidine kinase
MRDELQGVAVTVDVVPESLELDADPNLLDQVLLNLVRNAADALREEADPSMSLKARLSYGRILLTLQDNGSGIPDNVVDQVFVPFFTTKRDGSGIGLSLSRQIMTAHGGEIALRSDATGTTVSLVF